MIRMPKTSAALSRRELLCGTAILGMGAAVAAIGPVDSSLADEVKELEGEAVSGAAESMEGQEGFWVETDKCVDCGQCAHACRRHNETPEDVACRRKIELHATASGHMVSVSTSCMHCADPTCVKVCPAHAITKRESDGVVTVDKQRCIGCKYCYEGCPFGVPHYTEEGMDKCDCCLGNGAYPDQDPWCVQACPQGALHFGNIAQMADQAGPRAVSVATFTGPSLVVS